MERNENNPDEARAAKRAEVRRWMRSNDKRKEQDRPATSWSIWQKRQDDRDG